MRQFNFTAILINYSSPLATELDMNKLFLCPMPQVWDSVYKRLKIEYEKMEDPAIPPPPVPLILNGWAFSSDFEKKVRWNETLEWAKRYHLEELIPKLNDEQVYWG